MRQPIGILAYGSLIDDPGEEIKASTVHIERKNIMTPFRVEFARKSKERQGAPTLVPVNEGGASVKATLIVLKIDEEEAMNRLWRRETNRVGQKDRLYRHPETPRSNSVIIDRVEIAGVVALYARIPTNISPLNAGVLARFAVESARELHDGRDGISYLINTKKNGIATPLSPAYENEIKRLTRTKSLEEALLHLRTSEPPR